MPTVLLISGWRLFFYSNEGNEPPHIHAEKAEMSCKFWLKADLFEIEEAYAYRLSPGERKEIRRIIYSHFDYILTEWNKHFNDGEQKT